MSIRLYVEAPLTAGACLTLAKEQSHYLVTVMRQRQGDAVRLFNGRDGEWTARLADADRKAAVLEVAAQTRPQELGADLWLAFAVLKRAKTDLVAEKATELGASHVLPVFTARTVAERVKTGRLAAIAVEAAEQCERLSLPKIAEPASLAALLEDWPAGRTLVFCDESRTAAPLLDAVADRRGPFGLLVGPEGGFTDAERETIAAHPAALAVSLGPRVLRAETAAIAGLALLAAAAEDRERALQ